MRWFDEVEKLMSNTPPMVPSVLVGDINSGQGTCAIYVVCNKKHAILARFDRWPSLMQHEVTESVNAAVLAFQHHFCRGQIRKHVRTAIDLMKLEHPYGLPGEIFRNTALGKYEVIFPHCSEIRLSFIEMFQFVHLVSQWMPIYCLAKEEADFPPVPRALKCFLEWGFTNNNSMNTPQHVVPDTYPGYNMSPCFSDPRLFIKGFIGSSLTGHAIFNDFGFGLVTCSALGCTETRILKSTNLCKEHAKNNMYESQYYSPSTFVCDKQTGTWRARCPRFLEQHILLGHPPVIVRCLCGRPYLHIQNETQDMTQICTSCFGRRQRALDAFKVMTGLSYVYFKCVPDNVRSDSHNVVARPVTHDLPKVSIQDLELVNGVIRLLDLRRENITETIERDTIYASRSFAYYMNERDVTEIQGTLYGDQIIACLFEKFEIYYDESSRLCVPSHSSITVRSTLIDIGSASYLAGKSKSLQTEHADLSRACAAASLVTSEILREPLALCMEDSVIRLAQVYEVFDETVSVGNQLLTESNVTGTLMSTDDTQNTIPRETLAVFWNGRYGVFPVTAMDGARISLAETQHEQQHLRRCLYQNGLRAVSSKPHDISTISSAVSRTHSDKKFIATIIKRIRILRLVWRLRSEDRVGIQYGKKPALAYLRELLDRLGLTELARNGAIDTADITARLVARQRVLMCAHEVPRALRLNTDQELPTVYELHKCAHEIARKSLAYCPQDLHVAIDHETFYGLDALRNPFNLQYDLVHHDRARACGLAPCWILYEHASDTEIPVNAQRLWKHVFWFKKIEEEATKTEQIQSRLLLLSMQIDHRIYTPFGPSMAKAAASFLLRVMRSMMSEHDTSIKHAMSLEFDDQMAGKHVLNEREAGDAVTEMFTIPMSSPLVLSVMDHTSIHGQRLGSSELMSSAEAQVLSFANFDERPVLSDDYFEMIDLASAQQAKSMSVYRPGHLCAVPDVCRNLYGAHIEDNTLSVYSDYGAQALQGFSFQKLVEALMCHIDQHLRFDFLYATDGKCTNAQETSTVVPGLELIRGFPVKCTCGSWARDNMVHLVNYRGISIFDHLNVHVEMVSDAVAVAKACVTRRWNMSSHEILFLLESGLFRVDPQSDTFNQSIVSVRECITLLREKLFRCPGLVTQKNGKITRSTRNSAGTAIDLISMHLHRVNDICTMTYILYDE